MSDYNAAVGRCLTDLIWPALDAQPSGRASFFADLRDMELPISDIRTDGGTQPRSELDGPTVMEYAEAMSRGVEFPPVCVMYDGENYWLYDGFHRVKAAQNIDRTTIRVDVQQGTKQDAQWESLAANRKHGLRRSRADKRRAIKRALKGWGQKKSNRSIARHVGCDHKTVAKYRREMEPSGEIPQIKKRTVTRNGTTYTQDTSNIGKSRSKPTKPRSEPKSSSPPQIRSTPSQQRRKRFRRQSDTEATEPQWDDDFDDVVAQDDTQSQKQVVERYAKAAASIANRSSTNALADFADQQHKFSEEERAEVKKTLQSSIDALQRIADRIH